MSIVSDSDKSRDKATSQLPNRNRTGRRGKIAVRASQGSVFSVFGFRFSSFPEMASLGISLIGLAVACLIVETLRAIIVFDTFIPLSLLLLPSFAIAVVAFTRSVYSGVLRLGSLVSLATVASYIGPIIIVPMGNKAAFGASLGETLNTLVVLTVSLLIVMPVLLIEFKPFIDLRTTVLVGRRGVAALLILCSIVELGLIGSGTFTYGTLLLAGERDSGTLIAVLSFVSVVSVIATASSALTLGQRWMIRNVNIVSALPAAMGMISGLAWQFVAGRRSFAANVIIAGIFFLFGRYRQAGRTIDLKTIIVTGIVSMSLISVAWPAYFAMRIASYSIQRNREMPSLQEMLTLASELDQNELRADYSTNLSSRTTLAASSAIVIASARGFLNGEGLAVSLATATPPFLFSGKDRFLRQTPAIEVAWARMGVPLNDWANSLFIDSYMDFGPFGYATYLTLILGLLAIVSSFVKRNWYSRLVISSTLVFQALNVENTLTSYLVAFRSVAALLVIGAFVRWTGRFMSQLNDSQLDLSDG